MFRRSGSVVTWFVDGKMPDARHPEFAAALANHRFRSIETAASEEVSSGWVTPGDPSGDSFDLEDMELDVGIWLRLRIDRKRMPAAWLAIHRAQAERSAGRRLSVRERRELRLGLLDSLLPRVLPSVTLVDALYEPRERLILLFSSARRVVEEFERLFAKTFAVPLVLGDPATVAGRCGLERETLAYLDAVSPVRWPSAHRSHQRTAQHPLAAGGAEA